jgi:hypothetical protein
VGRCDGRLFFYIDKVMFLYDGRRSLRAPLLFICCRSYLVPAKRSLVGRPHDRLKLWMAKLMSTLKHCAKRIRFSKGVLAVSERLAKAG